MHEAIEEENKSFPFENIVEKLRGTPKSLDFDENDIESLFSYNYGRIYTFSILTLLYPSLDYKNLSYIGHIYPRSFFTDRKLEEKGIESNKIQFYKDNFNYIANLQLLEGTVNE